MAAPTLFEEVCLPLGRSSGIELSSSCSYKHTKWTFCSHFSEEKLRKFFMASSLTCWWR